MKSPLWFVAVLLTLAGCGQMVTIEPDPNSRYYMPPVGSVVKINEELTVRAGWARAFLQRGEEVRYGDIDRYYPSCNFELYTVDEMPQAIRPGSFTIVHVQRRDEEVVEFRPVQHASVSMLAGSGPDSGGTSMIMRTVRMKLESEENPNMYMLTCRGSLDDQHDAREISINEMRVALGDKATILLLEDL